MKTIISALLVMSLAFPGKITNDDANCIKHKYKGTWKYNDIFITIQDASFKNFLSYSGNLSGYTQYKKNVCPLKGTFKLKGQGVYDVTMWEESDEKYCNASFSGSFSCYSNYVYFDGLIITPGEYKQNYDELKMKSVD